MRALAVRVDSEVEDLESKAESIRYRAGISAANGHSDRWSAEPEPSEYLVECLNEVHKSTHQGESYVLRKVKSKILSPKCNLHI